MATIGNRARVAITLGTTALLGAVTFGSPVANALVGIVVCLVIFAIPLLLRSAWESFRPRSHGRVSTG
jgi:ABC-type sulfate transport system permease component